MPRAFRMQRLVTATASTALVAGGVLMPTGAFAASAAPQAGAVTATAGGHGDHREYNKSKHKKYNDYSKYGKQKHKRYGGNDGAPVTIIIIGNNNTVNGNGNGNGSGNVLT
ncbi:hypothetical protein ACWD00_39750 [Streptomyces viridiviolaceus]